MTPLFVAAQNGQADVVQLLLESGATPDAKTKVRCSHRFRNARATLLASSTHTLLACARAAVQDGSTALHEAASRDHCNVIRKLIDGGAGIEETNNIVRPPPPPSPPCPQPCIPLTRPSPFAPHT